ncbi:hypothetical protein EXIGLDRAFT_703118 [Exidia glandulosa HHB12029]|uniref:Uncharacterized protein n=1 Tax=Exidia glandulosa HHB12029 TaxID=1314781 RepID=A0A165C736_EXIGL|nr:hypothetical protein EXIGLDRAFT_703118 [Exidia glandulosa HHB12029]
MVRFFLSLPRHLQSVLRLATLCALRRHVFCKERASPRPGMNVTAPNTLRYAAIGAGVVAHGLNVLQPKITSGFPVPGKYKFQVGREDRAYSWYLLLPLSMIFMSRSNALRCDTLPNAG